MKNIKYLTLALLLFVLNRNNVNAGICNKASIEKYTNEAKNISVTYVYDDNYYVDEQKINGTYRVEIKNLLNYMYGEIYGTDIKFEYNEDDSIIKLGVESGIKKIIIYHEECEVILNTITLNLPIYNKYADREECKNVDVNELEVCDKWYKYPLNESSFQYQLKKYNENKIQNEETTIEEEKISYKTINFFRKYYLFIISPIAVIGIIILMIVIRKKQFDLE